MKDTKWDSIESFVDMLEQEGDTWLEQITQGKNPFEANAALSKIETCIDGLEQALDALDDRDWEKVRKELAPYLNTEEQKETWRKLGPLVQQYEAAEENKQTRQRVLQDIKQIISSVMKKGTDTTE